MKITPANNFMRIFRVPIEFPSAFCFGGGIPIEFQMVDWFNPVTDEMMENFNVEEHKKMIRKMIRKKVYYNPNYKYLAITDYNDSFLI
jgi:hypothetical protein